MKIFSNIRGIFAIMGLPGACRISDSRKVPQSEYLRSGAGGCNISGRGLNMPLISLRYYREDLIMGAEGLLLNVGTKRSPNLKP